MDFLEKFESFQYLTDEEKGILISISEIKQYNAGDIVIREGGVTYNNFLVVEGILRTYFTDESGSEKTLFLANEGLSIASADNLLYDRPASESVMAVVDTVVIVIDTRKFLEVSQDHIGLMRAYADAFKDNLKEAVERLEFYTKYKPKERYFHLLKTRPDFIQRVPQKYLASYLGMLPGSLSRIRTQTLKEKK